MPLVPELREGITAPTFAVLGNHDHIVDASGVVASLAAEGYQTLRNQHTVARVKGAPLTVLGVDDAEPGTTTWRPHFAALRAKPRAS